MKNTSLLSLLVLVAASPLAAAAWSSVSCGDGGGSYTANSTYEANLHRLAAVLPVEAAATHRRRFGYTHRAFGYWPNRLQAAWSCEETSDGDCAACIADAFKSVERECPFQREASFFGYDCSLRLSEYRILGSDNFGSNTMTRMLVMVMIFQAFGLSCLFFLFLQAWRRDTKKGAITRHTPLLSGDQYLSSMASTGLSTPIAAR